MMGGLHLKKQNQKPTHTTLQLRDVSGFTIVETLIVLAITGVLFVSIIGITSGRQSKTQFNQAATSIRAEIEQIIGEVQSGYYPNVTTNQGQNKDFVTVGKVMQFGRGLGTDPERYGVYSLITQRDAKNIGEAPVTTVEAATQTAPLKFGLTTKWMRVGGTTTNIGAVGFVTYFTERSNNLLYGSETTQVVPIESSDLESVDTNLGPHLVASYNRSNPPGGVQVCFDGGMGQSALVTIGGSSRANSVTLAIRNGNNCEL